jgi:alpha-ketoglutarate-dependent taurine dioxygenase
MPLAMTNRGPTGQILDGCDMTANSPFAMSPLTSTIGSLIEGVDLTDPLRGEVAAAIRQALIDRGVVFFRGQNLSSEQMHAFVSNFGTPVHIDYFGDPDDGTQQKAAAPDEIVTGSLTATRRGTAVWHTDIAWIPEPPFATALRAASVPPVGGDTCWANMEAAYDALSEPMKRMLGELTAVHSMQPTVDREHLLKQAMLVKGQPKTVETIHPVVTVHPETGRKALYVNECTTLRIVELSAIESMQVLTALFMHIRTPDFQCRWRWTANDLAFWDNRSVQHYAVPDYEEARVMQRIELAGAAPTAA